MPIKRPIHGKRNVLITGALPYVNNVPHLGNIVGSVLSGDVFARYCRLRDYETFYISGTDEYGTASETKALEEGKTPKQICDEYHVIHANIYKWFNIHFDEFGRTTNDDQTPLAQSMFHECYNNGYLSEQEVLQLFCHKCQRFLADRFVEGTCYYEDCKYEDARGDQCDKCGRLVNALQLKDPHCKSCGTSPETKKSKHFFFQLDKLEEKLKTWYRDILSRSSEPPKPLQSTVEVKTDGGEALNSEKLEKEQNYFLTKESTLWTNTAKAITESWHKEGLEPRCITRDLKWGTEVPVEGYRDKVFYVWFDAPIGYMSICSQHTKDWEKWWRGEEAQEQVELFQFMAKDNVPFHSIMFPAILFATQKPWVMVKSIAATDYLNYENEKFSKSRGIGVFGDDAQKTGIPADIWRFYLMYIRPENHDSSFCWDDFREKVNGELLNNLGNFINRAVSFVDKNFNGQLNYYEPNEEDKNYLRDVGQNLIAYEERLERVMLRDGLKPILAISRLGNQLIQSNKPWVLIKSGEAKDGQRAETVMHLALNTVAIIAMIIGPYMPEISEQIKSQLAMVEKDYLVALVDAEDQSMPLLIDVGHKIGQPALLFKRLELDQINDFKKRFGKKQN